VTCQFVVYTDQVQAFIALGPVVTAGHIEGFAKYLSDAVVEEKVNISVAVFNVIRPVQAAGAVEYVRGIT